MVSGVPALEARNHYINSMINQVRWMEWNWNINIPIENTDIRVLEDIISGISEYSYYYDIDFETEIFFRFWDHLIQKYDVPRFETLKRMWRKMDLI